MTDARDPQKELITALARGESWALGEAYATHHRSVRAFARRLLGDDDIAEDLVQETFLSLPNATRTFRFEGSFRSFVMGITAQHARHFLRSAIRKRNMGDRLRAVFPSPGERPPESSARLRQLAQELTYALDRLSDDHRLVIVLCEVEERTAGEVAAMLGLREATVRTRVHYAKKKLRELLESRQEEVSAP